MPQGLQQLHALNIVHNDVKAHNCLLQHQDNFLKLADLAYSVKLQTGMYFTPYLISLHASTPDLPLTQDHTECVSICTHCLAAHSNSSLVCHC